MSEKELESRKWQLTINNPEEKDWTHEKIKETINKFKGIIYWCMCDEKGSCYHTHIYMKFRTPVSSNTIQNRFPNIHREVANGTSQQNRDYIRKEGKWENSEKETTNYKNTFEESGDCPEEKQGSRTDLLKLYDMIKQGMSDYEIIEENPDYLFNLDKITRVRQTVLEEKYKNTFRNLEVVYIWGKTGTGKTRGVMEKYGYSNVYRVTDYLHPFDAYKGQDVVLFEEFRSCIRIDDMLKYLDGYPVEFPCRYSNKQACFTKVYIATNVDIREQYPNIQREERNTWEAFVRRIHNITVYTGKETITMPLARYLEIPYEEFIKNNPFTY